MEELALTPQALQGVPGLQQQPATGLGRLARPHLGQDPVRTQQPFDQDLHPPAARLVAEQPRTHHPGIVEDQQVAGAQQGGQIGEVAIRHPAARPIKAQQPARPPPRQWPLGDEIRRQVEVEVGAFHGRR